MVTQCKIRKTVLGEGYEMPGPCAECLAIIKYIRDRVATARNIEEALEVIDEIIETLEQEHIAGVIARIGIHNR